MQQFTNMSKEIRGWIILIVSLYVLFKIAIPAVGVLLYAEQVTNEALQASGEYVNEWYNWYYSE